MSNKILVISFSFEQEPDAFQALKDAGLEPVLWESASREGADRKSVV